MILVLLIARSLRFGGGWGGAWATFWSQILLVAEGPVRQTQVVCKIVEQSYEIEATIFQNDIFRKALQNMANNLIYG